MERGIRVVTQNIWLHEADWPARRLLLNEGLRKLQPDVVALQESITTSDYDQAADLLGGDYDIVHQRSRAPNGSGATIASRWPVTDVREISLNVTDRTNDPQRVALLARIAAPPPIGAFLFINNNPSYQWFEELERERQAVVAARAIEEWLAQEPMAVILAGDFNAVPDAASMRFWSGRQSLEGLSVCYQDAWANIHGDEPGHTFTPRNPLVSARWRPVGRRIDYIFVRCDTNGPTLDVAACDLIFASPVEGVWASDHFGVVADLEVPIGP